MKQKESYCLFAIKTYAEIKCVLRMKALDLFCGAGGLALGFRKAGFEVTGVDKNASAKETFEVNRIGDFIEADLLKVVIERDQYDIILGGPPCKPWAAVNLVRRGIEHHDYYLLSNAPNVAGVSTHALRPL